MATYDTRLCTRREAWLCEQPATKTVIVVAIRRMSGAILLACFCDQRTNLPCRFGERALVMVRLMLHHFRDQEFEVVGHALLQRIWRAVQEGTLQLAAHPYICAEYSMCLIGDRLKG